MEEKRTQRSKKFILWLLLILLGVPLTAWAAYRVGRPVTHDGGRIDQTYLWGMLFVPTAPPDPTLKPHCGLDFPDNAGTQVFAVADGVVTDLRESFDDGQGTDVGNFVLIRHDLWIWNRARQENSYPYSIYAHLQHDSVVPSIGAFVPAGSLIGTVDCTGDCGGSHLHSAVCLSPDPWANKDTVDRDNTSRNLEAWLTPYNGTTGTVVGKLTDQSGAALSNYRIVGLAKPYQTGAGRYQWSETYDNEPWANPDDILVDNWATTDVSPGTTYHLQAYDGGGGYFRDLGWHSVYAGEVTYVDLYPFYLPAFYSSWEPDGITRWAVRNNDLGGYTAQVNDTFFNTAGTGLYQSAHFIQPQASPLYYPVDGFEGSAVVVSSRRSAVAVVGQSDDESFAYTAIPPKDEYTGFPDGSDLGLAAAKTLYMPSFMNNYWNWRTKILVQNTGIMPTDITIDYYRATGVELPACRQTCWDVAPWERREVTPPQYCSLPVSGSVRLSASEPLAAVKVAYLNQGGYGPRRGAYNAFSEGGTTLYAPMLTKNFYGWYSSIHLRSLETSGGNMKVNVYYYRYNGNKICSDAVYLPPRGMRDLYQGAPGSCLASHDLRFEAFSARLVAPSGKKIIAVVNNDHDGDNDFYVYNAFVGGQSSLIFPWIKTASGWAPADILVQNSSTVQTRVDIYFYSQAGTLAGFVQRDLPGYGTWEVYGSVPANFEGSAVVRSTSQPIAAITNLLYPPACADGAVSYGGVSE